MANRQFVIPIAAVGILWAAMLFLACVQSSVVGTASSYTKPERTKKERAARIAKTAAPEPTTNPPIEPNDAIIGHWAPASVGHSGEKIELHADGTYDLWRYNCINLYHDYPIHGRYLFDGTEIRLGVEDQLRKHVETLTWFVWEYDGDTFLVTEENRHKLDMNCPTTSYRLHIRESDWDEAKQSAFHEALWNRYLETVPANACYPENVERPRNRRG